MPRALTDIGDYDQEMAASAVGGGLQGITRGVELGADLADRRQVRDQGVFQQLELQREKKRALDIQEDRWNEARRSGRKLDLASMVRALEPTFGEHAPDAAAIWDKTGKFPPLPVKPVKPPPPPAQPGIFARLFGPQSAAGAPPSTPAAAAPAAPPPMAGSDADWVRQRMRRQ